MYLYKDTCDSIYLYQSEEKANGKYGKRKSNS